MSAESPGGSRPPQTNSANAGSGSETAEPESRSKSLCELPSPQEKVREFLDGFGERAISPINTSMQFWHNPDTPVFEGTATAVEILKDAGYVWDPDGNIYYPEGKTEG